MSIAPKLMLLVVMAVAAMAVTAPSAFAEHAIEVTEETSGTHHCPPVELHGAQNEHPEGGCVASKHSTDDQVGLELFGSPLTTCSTEFELHVNEDGQGFLTNQVLAASDDCIAEPCPQGEGTEPWPVSGEETGNGAEHLFVDFCILIGGVDTRCEDLEVEIENLGNHIYEFHADAAQCADPSQHVTGEWTSESDDMELIHLDTPHG